MTDALTIPKPRKSGWTDARRKAQAEMMRALKPWEKSTGPRTPAGKARSSRNAFKPGTCRTQLEIIRSQKAMMENLLTVYNLARQYRMFARKKFVPGLAAYLFSKGFQGCSKIPKNELLKQALRLRLIRYPTKKRLQRLILKALFVGRMPGPIPVPASGFSISGGFRSGS